MDGNPIKYSDLVQADDSIKNAKKQLDELASAFSNLKEKAQDGAAQLRVVLESTTTATAAGREETTRAAGAVDKLARAQADLAYAYSERGKELARVQNELKEVNQLNKATAKMSDQLTTSYNRLSAEYIKNKIALNNMTKAERENTKEGKKLVKDTKAIYDEMKRLQEVTGKTSLNVGNYSEAMGKVPGLLGDATNSVKVFVQQLWTLATHPVVLVITLIVGALKLLYDGLVSTYEGQRRVNEVVAVANAIWQVFLNILSAVALLLTDKVPAAIQIVANAWRRFILDAQRLGKDLEAGWLRVKIAWDNLWGNDEAAEKSREKLEEVRKEQARLLQETEDLDEEQAKLMKTMTEGWDDIWKLIKGAGDEIKKNAKTGIDLAAIEHAALMRSKVLMVENAKLQVQADSMHAKAEQIRRADAQKGLEYLNAAYDARQRILQNEVELAKMAHNAAKLRLSTNVNNKAYIKAEIDANVALLEAQAKLGAVERERARQSNRFNTQAIAQNFARIKANRKIYDALAAEQMRYDARLIEQTRLSVDEQLDAAERLAETALLIHHRRMNDEAKALEDRLRNGTVSYEDYTLFIEALKKQLDANIIEQEEVQAERVYQIHLRSFNERKRLRERWHAIELDWLELRQEIEMIDIEISRRSEATKTRMKLQAEKKAMKERLALMKKNTALYSTTEIKLLEEHLRLIDYEIAQAKKAESIWELLGLSLDDDTKEALTSAFDFALGQLNDFLQAKIDIADQAVKAADKEVAATQKMLDLELQARANGYASNVEFARKERELAEDQQREAVERKKRFQKAQEKIQAAEQASSLITATALIWSQLGNPLLAIPAIAVMWGSFAAAKIQAKKATEGTEEYGSGHVELLRGGSHASGNDIDLGVKADGTRRRAEGGEYFAVINKRSSRRFGKAIPDIMNSLNDGTFPEKYANVFSGGGSLTLTQSQTSIDLERIERDLREIRDNSSKRKYVDAKGNVIEEYKNLKRVIKS